jgi:excisionase family DNA binding protein
LTGPWYRLRYAQHTKTHSNAVESRNWFSQFPQRGRKGGVLREKNLWKRKRLMGDSREVMNIRQASQYLGVSPDTLYKYVNEQSIPAFKLGNRWRFKKSKLDQWMEEKSMEQEPRGKKKAKAAIKAAGQL